jgi:hypothetical protein
LTQQKWSTIDVATAQPALCRASPCTQQRGCFGSEQEQSVDCP